MMAATRAGRARSRAAGSKAPAAAARRPVRDYGPLLRDILPREKGRPGKVPKACKKPEEAGYLMARAGVDPKRVSTLLGELNGERDLVDAEIARGASEYQAKLEASLSRVAVSQKGSATTKTLVARNRLSWAVNLPQMEQAADAERNWQAGVEDAQGALIKIVDQLLERAGR